MAYLIVREPGRVAYTLPLTSAITAGRGGDNDLVLADGKVSRRHLRIEPDGRGFRVIDLASTHGTLVGGAPAREHALGDREVVQLGAVLLVYRAGAIDEDGAIQRTISTVAEPPVGDDGRRLRVLYDIGRVLSALDSVEDVLERLLETALAALGATRGLIGVVERGRGARQVARGDLVVGAGALTAMLQRREAVLVRSTRERCMLGAPLDTGERVAGFLCVDDGGRAAGFGDADLDFIAALARLSAAILDRALRQQQLAAARDILGASAAVRALRADIEKCAPARDTSVLIRGETGTGKELVAEHLHARSPRCDAPFVAVNCAAIPDTLVESELFGHAKGAFTGAIAARRGRFAAADGGTIFLDEVADLSLAAQAKLLRVLEEGEVQPVGGDAQTVDVRVISATHKDLEAEVAAGRFREDLYYRLDVVTLDVPPLRRRGDDVALLAEHFRIELGPRVGRATTGFTDDALAALRSYGWPGNVRQLRNEIERALLFAEGPRIAVTDLRHAGERLSERWTGLDRAAAQAGEPALTAIETAERELFAEALRKTEGNVAAAAQALGISRGTFYRKIEKYNLSRAR